MSRLMITLETFVLTCTLAATANAQATTTSFDEVRFIVKTGDTITVRETDGTRVKGTLLTVSPSSLVLNVNGVRRELAEQDVSRILTRRPDSVWNGALVGVPPAIIAAAFASERGTGFAVAAGLIHGGISAAIGIGIDALITKREVVYERPHRQHVGVSPVVGSHRRGVALSVTF